MPLSIFCCCWCPTSCDLPFVVLHLVRACSNIVAVEIVRKLISALGTGMTQLCTQYFPPFVHDFSHDVVRLWDTTTPRCVFAVLGVRVSHTFVSLPELHGMKMLNLERTVSHSFCDLLTDASNATTIPNITPSIAFFNHWPVEMIGVTAGGLLVGHFIPTAQGHSAGRVPYFFSAPRFYDFLVSQYAPPWGSLLRCAKSNTFKSNFE